MGWVGEALELNDRYIAEGAVGEAEDESPLPILLRMLRTAVLVKDRETSEMLHRRLSVVRDMALIGTPWVPRILGEAPALLGNHDERAEARDVNLQPALGRALSRREILKA